VKFDTKVVRAGITPDPTTGSILPPIYETATYVLEEVGKDKGFDYTRSSNPTRQVLEENLAAIEGGKYAICFASGMSAVDSVMKLLSAGDHVISSDDVYGGVSRLFNRVLARYGLNFSYVNSSEPEAVRKAIRPETKMLWVETPTNPLLKVTDLVAMADIAKQDARVNCQTNKCSHADKCERNQNHGLTTLQLTQVEIPVRSHGVDVGSTLIFGIKLYA